MHESPLQVTRLPRELPNVPTDMIEMGKKWWMMKVHHTIFISIPRMRTCFSCSRGMCVFCRAEEGKQRTTVRNRLSVTTRGHRFTHSFKIANANFNTGYFLVPKFGAAVE